MRNQVEFPFPSNGNAYHKEHKNAMYFDFIDSFPFPSNGNAYHKEHKNAMYFDFIDSFPFPSNGNAYHKFCKEDAQVDGGKVSIPFKRERVSQETPF